MKLLSRFRRPVVPWVYGWTVVRRPQEDRWWRLSAWNWSFPMQNDLPRLHANAWPNILGAIGLGPIVVAEALDHAKD